jgi:hypothetical protein
MDCQYVAEINEDIPLEYREIYINFFWSLKII